MLADALNMPIMAEEERNAGGRQAPRRPMNEAEFEQFYRRNASGLWSYILRLTGDAATADDLLQKAFFRFLRTNPVLSGEEHMRRYLFKTATNLAFDHFRDRKREREHSEVVVGTTNPREQELRHDMRRVFGELKPRERALLWLAHVEEADHGEIGEALGVKAKSVKVLLFRARKRLAEILTRNGIGPGGVR